MCSCPQALSNALPATFVFPLPKLTDESRYGKGGQDPPEPGRGAGIQERRRFQLPVRKHWTPLGLPAASVRGPNFADPLRDRRHLHGSVQPRQDPVGVRGMRVSYNPEH